MCLDCYHHQFCRLEAKLSKPNIKEAASSFVERASPTVDDIKVDVHSPGFFDEIFYKEVAQSKDSYTKDEPDSEAGNSNESSAVNVIDDQYFGNVLNEPQVTCNSEDIGVQSFVPDPDLKIFENLNDLKPHEIVSEQNAFVSESASSTPETSDMNVVDQQYFESLETSQRLSNINSSNEKSPVKLKELDVKHQTVHNTASNLSPIDSQYFGSYESSSQPTVQDNLKSSADYEERSEALDTRADAALSGEDIFTRSIEKSSGDGDFIPAVVDNELTAELALNEIEDRTTL